MTKKQVNFKSHLIFDFKKISRENFSSNAPKKYHKPEENKKKTFSFTNVSVGICRRNLIHSTWLISEIFFKNKDQNWFSLIILVFEEENPQNRDFWISGPRYFEEGVRCPSNFLVDNATDSFTRFYSYHKLFKEHLAFIRNVEN